jgi:hypothetical protein
MRLLSFDGEPSVISVGQQALGIFALGQFARGFIAVGQVAIGVVAVGQGAVGIFALGQGGLGVTWFAGMLGFGGRGFCLRLIPGLDPPRIAPKTVSIESLEQGQAKEGMVRVLVEQGSHLPRLRTKDRVLSVKLTPEVASALISARAAGHAREVFAKLERIGDVLVCNELVEVPGSRRSYSFGFQAFRVAGLMGLGIVWWWLFLTGAQ